ncbi:MAG: hypothetical protein PWP31_1379 [Clostridia bacterium]|nr:hypothetical protein [Clostridia bacterium]
MLMEIIRRNTDYGVRALVYIAANSGNIVSAKDISDQMEIPIEFLQKILQKFVRIGLVNSYRGAHGGFSLAKDPSEVSVLEIVEALQGKLSMNKCLLGKDGCPRAPQCPLKNNWINMEQKLIDFMNGITLQDLVDQYKANA